MIDPTATITQAATCCCCCSTNAPEGVAIPGGVIIWWPTIWLAIGVSAITLAYLAWLLTWGGDS